MNLKKVSGIGAVKAGKGFTLFISNEDMGDIIKVVEEREKSGLLIDTSTETVEHGINKQEVRFTGAMIASMAALL